MLHVNGTRNSLIGIPEENRNERKAYDEAFINKLIAKYS